MTSAKRRLSRQIVPRQPKRVHPVVGKPGEEDRAGHIGELRSGSRREPPKLEELHRREEPELPSDLPGVLGDMKGDIPWKDDGHRTRMKGGHFLDSSPGSAGSPPSVPSHVTRSVSLGRL